MNKTLFSISNFNKSRYDTKLSFLSRKNYNKLKLSIGDDQFTLSNKHPYINLKVAMFLSKYSIEENKSVLNLFASTNLEDFSLFNISLNKSKYAGLCYRNFITDPNRLSFKRLGDE